MDLWFLQTLFPDLALLAAIASFTDVETVYALPCNPMANLMFSASRSTSTMVAWRHLRLNIFKF
jgi:hypothetical protein